MWQDGSSARFLAQWVVSLLAATRSEPSGRSRYPMVALRGRPLERPRVSSAIVRPSAVSAASNEERSVDSGPGVEGHAEFLPCHRHAGGADHQVHVPSGRQQHLEEPCRVGRPGGPAHRDHQPHGAPLTATTSPHTPGKSVSPRTASKPAAAQAASNSGREANRSIDSTR